MRKFSINSVGDTKKSQIMTVLFLAFPSIVEQIMLTAVSYVDTAMVGSLGATATASIGINASTLWLFGAVFTTAAIGFSVQVAQYVGADKIDNAKDVIRQSVLFNVVFGVFIMLVGVGLSFFLPNILGADPAIAQDSSTYFRIMSFAMPFTLATTLFSSIIRCMGDTVTPMVLNVLVNIINVFLNLIFIFPTREVTVFGDTFTMFGLGLGVTGAGIASAISTAVVAISLVTIIFVRKGSLQISLKDSFKPKWQYYKSAGKLGLPVFLERGSISLAQIVFTVLVTGIGTSALAAHHLAVTAEALSYLPAYGISAAATTLIGQAIGANKKELATSLARISVIMGIVLMTITGVLLFFFATPLISLFTKDAEVITLGAKVLKIVALAQPLFAASIVTTGCLRGSGDTKWPFYISSITMWGVRITLALILSKEFGLVGIWWSMAIELWVRGIVFLIRLYSNKWLHIKQAIKLED